MPRMNAADEVALNKWQNLFSEAEEKYNAATTEAEKDKWYVRRAHAATVIAGIGERANARRNTLDRHRGKKKVEYDPASDPEPEHHKDCGLNCVRGCPWDAWDDRRIAHGLKKVVAPAVPVTEQPKPAPVVAPPVVVAPPKIAPLPKIALRPAPVVREPKEGTSGFFYKENFWNIDADERRGKMMLVNGDPGLKAEWQSIVETMAIAAMLTLA